MVGKGSGKLGSTVVASVAGYTIARQYNPNVTNPNSDAQQDTRARFKLLSQLSAVMAPALAIRKKGLTSARNIFTKVNFPLTSFNGSEAMVDMNRLQITDSSKSMTDFSVDRSSGTEMAVQLVADASANYDRVVYVAYEKNEMGEILALDSIVVSNAGEDGLFAGKLAYTANAVVIYAYGIKDIQAGITTKFGNLQAPTADQVARLVTASSENMSSVSLTRTKGVTMVVGVVTARSTFEPIEVSALKLYNSSILPTVSGTVEIDQDLTQLTGSYTPVDAEEVDLYFEYSADGQEWTRTGKLTTGVNGEINQGVSIRPNQYGRCVIYQQGIRVFVSQMFYHEVQG